MACVRAGRARRAGGVLRALRRGGHDEWEAIDPTTVSVAEVLARNGYETAGIVANGLISNYGDYGHWVSKSFSLSEVLCSVNNSIAATFVQTLKTTGTNTFWLEVNFKANDNFDNCGTGLYVDNLVLSETCVDWGQCM